MCDDNVMSSGCSAGIRVGANNSMHYILSWHLKALAIQGNCSGMTSQRGHYTRVEDGRHQQATYCKLTPGEVAPRPGGGRMGLRLDPCMPKQGFDPDTKHSGAREHAMF